jgi:hypothetical protein
MFAILHTVGHDGSQKHNSSRGRQWLPRCDMPVIKNAVDAQIARINNTDDSDAQGTKYKPFIGKGYP